MSLIFQKVEIGGVARADVVLLRLTISLLSIKYFCKVFTAGFHRIQSAMSPSRFHPFLHFTRSRSLILQQRRERSELRLLTDLNFRAKNHQRYVLQFDPHM